MNINSVFNNFSNFEDSIIIKIEYTEDGSKNFSIFSLFAIYVGKI